VGFGLRGSAGLESRGEYDAPGVGGGTVMSTDEIIVYRGRYCEADEGEVRDEVSLDILWRVDRVPHAVIQHHNGGSAPGHMDRVRMNKCEAAPGQYTASC